MSVTTVSVIVYREAEHLMKTEVHKNYNGTSFGVSHQNAHLKTLIRECYWILHAET